jgi:glycosyltransferase involved in cell wall biosynthesis
MPKKEAYMSGHPRFNYIITIHNKEDLIEQVIMSVLMCCRDNSHIYPVIDGCTDRTEEIIDRLICTYSGVPITKVHASDVHEILSINAGLKVANQEADGFNIILQDDVVLADFMLEQKVVALYKWAGSQLGFVSFRFGANFKKDAATSNDAVPYCDYVENAYGHGIQEAEVLLPGHFAYRSAVIKSPVCIPTKLIRTIGVLEERLAPYCHDDLEYSMRSIKAGYKNGVFPLRFFSDVKWGGTRTTPHPELNNIIDRNMRLIRTWQGPDLADICQSNQPKGIVEVPNMSGPGDAERAIKVWNETRDNLTKYQDQNQSSFRKLAKYILKKCRV